MERKLQTRPPRLILLLATLTIAILTSIPIPALHGSGLGTIIQVWSRDASSNDLVDTALTPGRSFTLEVQATNLPPITGPMEGGINGFDITLTYDPSAFKATDIDYKPPLCPLSDGCIFDRASAFQISRTVDSPPGTTRLAVLLLGDHVDNTDGIILFRVVFQVQALGFTTVEIQQPDSLISLGANSVPYKPVNGRFENRTPFRLGVGLSSGQNASVTISVTQVWKIQPFTETINLDVASLPPNSVAAFTPLSGTLNFTSQLTITTTNTPRGSYLVTVTGTSFPSYFRANTTFGLIVKTIDLEVVSLAPSPTQVEAGSTVSITANVRNNGSEMETFDLNLKANGTAIAQDTNIPIAPEDTNPITLNWDTTGVPTGRYTISAEIPPITGEVDVNNNILIDGTVSVVRNFTISLSQAAGTLLQGNSMTVTVDLNLISTVPEMVTLSLTGLGTGVTGTFTPSSGLPTFTTTLNLTATASAATGTFSLQVTGTSSSLTRTAGFTLTVKATHDVSVVSISAGPTVVNPGGTTTVSVTVGNNGASTETFTINVSAVSTSGATLVGTGQATNLAPDQTTTIQVSWSTQSSPSGSYTLKAEIPTVTGEQNTGDNTLSQATVRINTPPSASFALTPASLEVGTAAAFDASASTDPDGSVLTYVWNFGDRTPNATGRSTTHTYQTPGEYTVTLTITDNDGATTTRTQAITIAQPSGVSPLVLAGITIIMIAILSLILLLRRRSRLRSPRSPSQA